MTKKEKDLCMRAVITILRDMKDIDVDLYSYLETDVYMMIDNDLEAIRIKQNQLPMSGLKYDT